MFAKCLQIVCINQSSVYTSFAVESSANKFLRGREMDIEIEFFQNCGVDFDQFDTFYSFRYDPFNEAIMETFCTALCDFLLKLDPDGTMTVISECLPNFNPLKIMSNVDRKYFMSVFVASYSEELDFGYSRYKSIESGLIASALTFDND